MKFACFVLLALSAVLVKAASDDAETLKHLKDREGYSTVGYFPTDTSGVTIGIGIDLGQQTKTGLTAKGISSTIITKLEKYLGYKSKAALYAAGLNEKNLVLTTAEADALSMPFIKEAINIVLPYSTNMSIKGHAALVSLRHWAGSLGCNNCKLSTKVNGVDTNYIWQAISGKTATTAQLKTALEKLVAGNKKECDSITSNKPSYCTRPQHEVDYLK